jgi:hypothetical protein
MDTLQAFAIGRVSRGNPTRVFDWDQAARIIVNGGVKNAEAGLRDDWEWTGGPILKDGIPVPAGKTYTYLASTWAIPELLVSGECVVPCWTWQTGTEWDAHTYWPGSALEILESRVPKMIG